MKQKNGMTAILTLLCFAVLLFAAATVLKPIAVDNAAMKKLQIMEQLLPESETFTPEAYDGGDTKIVAVYKGEIGHVVETKVSGYVDHMTLLVGVDTEGTVTGLTVWDTAETFGLGKRAMNDMDFLRQFIGTKGDAAVGKTVDALTGATVSSMAVAKAVNAASAVVTGVDTSSSATGADGASGATDAEGESSATEADGASAATESENAAAEADSTSAATETDGASGATE